MKLSWKQFLLFCMIVVFILRSGSPFSLAYQSFSVIMLLILFSITSAVVVLNYRKYNYDRFTFVLIFAFGIILNMFISNEFKSYIAYSIQIMNCLTAFNIVLILGSRKFLILWRTVFRVLICSSLVLYILVQVASPLLPVIDTGITKYYTIVVSSQIITDGRISGSAWEPSMFAVLVSITILVELLYFRKSNIRKYFVLVELSVLFLAGSFSSFVYAITIFAIYTSTCFKNKKNRHIIVSTYLFAIISLIVLQSQILNFFYFLAPEYFYKIVEQDVSFLTRIYNPVADILTFIANPFGVGISEVENIVRTTLFESLGSKDLISRTSTWSYYFAAFGFTSGLSFNSLWLLGVFQNRNFAMFERLLLAVLFLYFLTSVVMINNLAIWSFIMFLSMTYNLKNKGVIANEYQKEIVIPRR